MARVAGGAEAASRLRVCAIGDSMWNDIKGAANEASDCVAACPCAY
jgi:ribonucleotide monophosphatase NagD (HAD superfamily)